MKYTDVNLNKPFYILRPNGDCTVWRRNDHGLDIFFHIEGFWCNPPTDSRIEGNAVKAIEKYGIEYLPEDYVDIWQSQVGWDAKQAYAIKVADEVFGELVVKRVKKAAV